MSLQKNIGYGLSPLMLWNSLSSSAMVHCVFPQENSLRKLNRQKKIYEKLFLKGINKARIKPCFLCFYLNLKSEIDFPDSVIRKIACSTRIITAAILTAVMIAYRLSINFLNAPKILMLFFKSMITPPEALRGQLKELYFPACLRLETLMLPLQQKELF